MDWSLNQNTNPQKALDGAHQPFNCPSQRLLPLSLCQFSMAAAADDNKLEGLKREIYSLTVLKA